MKPIIGIVLLILAVAGGANFIRNAGRNHDTQSSGSAAYDQGRKAGKYTAPVVLAALGLLGIRLLLQSGGARGPAPERRAGTDGSLPRARDPSLRGGQNTFASNPGLIRLNLASWMAANPWVPIVAGTLALTGAIMFLFSWPVGLVLCGSAAVFLDREIRRAKQKFYAGDVCPGVVISAQYNLVAVFTNLMTGSNDPKPAIKILKQPLGRLSSEAAYDGMRVAAVALYYGQAREGAWRDFSPEVINCVVREPEEIARVLGSIPEREWQNLDSNLSQIPEARVGLYRLWDTKLNAAPGMKATAGRTPMSLAGTPWFKTASAIAGFSVVVVLAVLLVLVSVVGSAMRRKNNQIVARPKINISREPSPTVTRNRAPLSQTGDFLTGSAVSAHWGGKWIPGTIKSINPGGFSVMVKLEDPRFPHAIVLSTNQIRVR